MPAVQTDRHEPLGLARIVMLFESAAGRSLCRYVKKAMDANVRALWFNPGIAVVRDRAFRNDEERRAFLNAVTKYLS